MSLLELNDLVKKFGGKVALDGISLGVPERSIIGLIGPNGSGKSTLINVVSGLLSADAGSIVYKGQDITNLRIHKVSRLGLVRTFQISRPFAEMSILDNLLAVSQQGLTREVRRRANEVLAFVGLERVADQKAGAVSYGQQRLVELGRVLMLDPELILLDEPVAGVNPTLIEQLKDLILELHEQGKSFVIVEHNVQLVSDVCQRLVVLHNGEKIADGSVDEVQRNPEVIGAYLGTGSKIRKPERKGSPVE